MNWPVRFIWALAFLVYSLVIYLNDGFMALDEYFVGITRYIPAQNASLFSLVTVDDVKSPLQIMPMYYISQAANALGVSSPYWQYRSVLAVLGFLNFGLLAWAFYLFARAVQLTEKVQNFLVLILTFYFAAAFTFTRPMFESLGAPWLALATVFAIRYDRFERRQDLLWGVFFVSVAFVLRQQLGLCALVFLILPALKKRWRDLGLASVVGLVFLMIAGIPDIWMRGAFHYSLKSILFYNVEHGKDYGNQSLAYYPALLFLLSFFPFLIAKYPKGFIRETLKAYRPVWIVLLLFVILHSMFPQKWERFLISILPQVMLLVFPFLWYLQQSFKNYKIRLVSLYGLNFLLFFLASFFPPQKNLIEMSRYLDQHPEIKTVYRIAETPEWITDAFIRDRNYSFAEAEGVDLDQVDFAGCTNAIVIGEGHLEQYRGLISKLKKQAEFNVNLIEQLSYKMNPSRNLRRVKLSLYCRP